MDANATTPLLPEVVAAMQPWWTESFGNASSVHHHGRQARSAVDHARESVATLLGAKPAQIVFTSGGTESDNLALFGTLKPAEQSGNSAQSGAPAHLITTRIEHHAILHAAEELERQGIQLSWVEPDRNGVVHPEEIERLLRPNTRLISVMLANNETGAIQPINAIAEIANRHNALLHTDAVQATGKLPISVDELGCDLLSLSGHKFHGPQGTGALYVRPGLQLAPLFHGGNHERQRRAGTENVPGLVGLGKAADLAREALAAGHIAHLAALRDRLESRLTTEIGGTTINSAQAPRVANTISIAFSGIDAEALMIALDLKGLSVSTGSACQSGAMEPSHVLLAMGLSQGQARSSLRISLTRLNTVEEVDTAAQTVIAAVARQRTLV